jgi:hypothetical protein
VNFENSFKWWFALQWQNKNILYFIPFMTMLILQLANFGTVWGWLMESYDDGIGTGLFCTPFMFIPLLGTFLIVYKGFWQHFDDLSKGRSR